MTLVKFNHRNRSIDPWVDGIFHSLFNEVPATQRLVPSVNISETDAQYEVELAAPGLKKDDFKINLEKSVLTISVEKKEETKQDEKKYTKREFAYTAFSRSFNLPEQVDAENIAAAYTDGVLKITLPKKEDEKDKVKMIEVK